MHASTIGGSSPRHDNNGVLRHWFWAIPLLLVVYAIGLQHSDLYPPTTDEFYSMNNSGWLVNGSYSPLEILQSLQRNSPNHSPFYFLLLSFWGNITANDIMLARVLSILFAMLAMALIYRLGTDFIEAPAGLFALIIVASNAYFNHHIAFARMYTLLLFLAAAVLWLYLRIMHQQRKVRRLDYLSLGGSLCARQYFFVQRQLFNCAWRLLFALRREKSALVEDFCSFCSSGIVVFSLVEGCNTGRLQSHHRPNRPGRSGRSGGDPYLADGHI